MRSVSNIPDPVVCAGTLMARIARSQAFDEGNKRTALLAAQWVLENNGVNQHGQSPLDDPKIGRLLVQAATGLQVEQQIVVAVQQNLHAAAHFGRDTVPSGFCGASTSRGTACRRRGHCPYHMA